jgi:hypothetical protein
MISRLVETILYQGLHQLPQLLLKDALVETQYPHVYQSNQILLRIMATMRDVSTCQTMMRDQRMTPLQQLQGQEFQYPIMCHPQH